MTPLERSAVYGGFAAAFRSATGGSDVLDETMVPAPPDDAGAAFMAAFDPAISSVPSRCMRRPIWSVTRPTSTRR